MKEIDNQEVKKIRQKEIINVKIGWTTDPVKKKNVKNAI